MLPLLWILLQQSLYVDIEKRWSFWEEKSLSFNSGQKFILGFPGG